jgi:hypothetical protein
MDLTPSHLTDKEELSVEKWMQIPAEHLLNSHTGSLTTPLDFTGNLL